MRLRCAVKEAGGGGARAHGPLDHRVHHSAGTQHLSHAHPTLYAHYGHSFPLLFLLSASLRIPALHACMRLRQLKLALWLGNSYALPQGPK